MTEKQYIIVKEAIDIQAERMAIAFANWMGANKTPHLTTAALYKIFIKEITHNTWEDIYASKLQ